MMQKKLKSGTDNLAREEKISVLKECLSGIGSRIDEIVAEKQAAGQSGSRWRKHCWMYVVFPPLSAPQDDYDADVGQLRSLFLAESGCQLHQTPGYPSQTSTSPHL